MHGNASAKDILRKEMREKLRTLTPGEVEKFSAKIRSRLTFSPGEKIALFAGLPTEPQLLSLIEKYPTTSWHLPRVTGQGTMEFVAVDGATILKRGPFGILEPPAGVTATTFDTILCPGIAFSSDGARLGQGGGYYDRYLQNSRGARLIGIAFSCQLVTDLPHDHHDISMHEIVTS